MVVLLLIMIVCILLFGKEEVKTGCLALVATIIILGIIGSLL